MTEACWNLHKVCVHLVTHHNIRIEGQPFKIAEGTAACYLKALIPVALDAYRKGYMSVQIKLRKLLQTH